MKEAGHGHGWAGFALRLPERLFDGELHRLVVRCAAPGAAPFIAEIALDLPVPLPQPAPILPMAAPSPGEGQPAATYVPGQYVVCMKPALLPVYHVRGWHDPEAAFTWIAGIEGVIEMAIHRPQFSYTFMIEVVPNDTGNRLQDGWQRIGSA